MQQVKKHPDLDKIFKAELETRRNTQNEKVEFLYYGKLFESRIDGLLQKIRPFVARKYSLNDDWSEIGIGIVSEDGYYGFWSFHDFGLGIKCSSFEKLKKSLDTLSLVQNIEDSTLAHCFYVETGEMTFNKITGTFKGKKIFKDLEESKTTEKPKKSSLIRNLLIFVTISIILYLIFG